MTFLCCFFYVARLNLITKTFLHRLTFLRARIFFLYLAVIFFLTIVFCCYNFSGLWQNSRDLLVICKLCHPIIISCCNILCTFLHLRVCFALHYFEACQCNCKQIVQLCFFFYRLMFSVHSVYCFS